MKGHISKTFSNCGIGNVYAMNKIFDKTGIKNFIMNEVKIHQI